MTEYRTRASDTADKEGGKATRCLLHQLYYTDTCWKCVKELAAGGITPAEAVQIALVPVSEVDQHDIEPKEAVPLSQSRPATRAVPGVVTNFLNTANLGNQSSFDILEVCLELAAFLLEKNAAYGDSALDPVRCLSKSDPMEQIRVRIDDKLSRLFRGHAGGEDALKDLVGYWVLLQVLEKRDQRPPT